MKLDKLDIKFQDENFIYQAISYEKKKNILFVNQFGLDNKFIKKTELKMGQIPKRIKKQLNPLSSKK